MEATNYICEEFTLPRNEASEQLAKYVGYKIVKVENQFEDTDIRFCMRRLATEKEIEKDGLIVKRKRKNRR